jgi:hypothetical protein
MKSKLWYWGSYGTQDIKVGVVGFYKKTRSAADGVRSTRARRHRLLRSCLETDLDDAEQLQLEADLRAVQEQPLQLPEHLGGKGPQRARRGDLRRSRPPIGRRPWRATSAPSAG